MPLTLDQQLLRRTMRWARKPVNPKHVNWRNCRAKVGSCSPDGVITLAHDLVEMSEEFQDYVIVHELLHPLPNAWKSLHGDDDGDGPRWRELEESSITREVRHVVPARQEDPIVDSPEVRLRQTTILEHLFGTATAWDSRVPSAGCRRRPRHPVHGILRSPAAERGPWLTRVGT